MQTLAFYPGHRGHRVVFAFNIGHRGTCYFYHVNMVNAFKMVKLPAFEV